MPNILDEIVAAKAGRTHIPAPRRSLGLPQGAHIRTAGGRSRWGTHWAGGGVRLMAEVKKASPSRGLLSPDFDPVRLAGAYTGQRRVRGVGAHRPSLPRGSRSTSPGSNSRERRGTLRCCGRTSCSIHTRSTRPGPSARDAILLIVSILEPAQLKDLLDLASELGMQSLVEIHDESELEVAVDAERPSSASTTATCELS